MKPIYLIKKTWKADYCFWYDDSYEETLSEMVGICYLSKEKAIALCDRLNKKAQDRGEFRKGDAMIRLTRYEMKEVKLDETIILEKEGSSTSS